MVSLGDSGSADGSFTGPLEGEAADADHVAALEEREFQELPASREGKARLGL